VTEPQGKGLFDEDWLIPLLEAAAEPLRQAIVANENPERVQKAVTDAIGESIPEAASRLAQTVEQHARRTLRHNQKLRAGFERRLRTVWAKGFAAYEVVVWSANELGEEYWKQHYASVVGTSSASKLHAMTGLHARACRTAFEVLTLLHGGFPVAAYARWRTLHELAIVGSILATRDPGLSERFLDHAIVEQASDAEEYQKHAIALGHSLLSVEDLEKLRAARDIMVGRYGPEFARDRGWAATLTATGKAPSIRSLEALAGLKHQRPYYRLSSHGVHAGARASELNLVRLGSTMTFMAGATNAGLAEVAHASLISLLQVTANLVIHGRHGYVGYNEVVFVSALNNLVDRAGAILAKIEEAVYRETKRRQSGGTQGPDH
jgi:Family of unknown function (DUF5677)